MVKARSNLGMPIVLEAIEKILPTLYMSLFGTGKEPFYLRPTGRTTPEAARAKAKVLSWAIKQSDLKEAMRRSLKTCPAIRVRSRELWLGRKRNRC